MSEEGCFKDPIEYDKTGENNWDFVGRCPGQMQIKKKIKNKSIMNMFARYETK